MAFKTVSLSKSVLVNLGDYQNEKVEVSIAYELEPGETVDQAHVKVADECRALLAREVAPVLGRIPSWRAVGWRNLLGIPAPDDDEDPDEGDDEDDEDDADDEWDDDLDDEDDTF